MLKEIPKTYIDRLRDYIDENMGIGTEKEIKPLTNDKDKFLTAIKYIIDNYRSDLEISSDHNKIRINPAYH